MCNSSKGLIISMNILYTGKKCSMFFCCCFFLMRLNYLYFLVKEKMYGKVSKESAWEKFESRDWLGYIQSTTIADIN